MTAPDRGPVLLLGAAVAIAVVAMAVTALIARRINRVNVVDVTWGVALTAIAVTSAIVGEGPHRWLILALVAVWGCRLSFYMFQRSGGHGEDPRYVEMLGAPLDHGGFRTAIGKVFVMQGAAVCFVALPVLVGASVEHRLTWLALVGTAIWLVGLLFEAVGDAQLAAYKRDPDRGPVLDRGLWAWTRHPNYFGDACIWWGIWLVAVDATPWALLTIPAPATMTYFLVHATGARLLEQTMMNRPGYPEYAARTPMFLPRPPKR
jgi:steroid 5-alpha reductase family enzyme